MNSFKEYLDLKGPVVYGIPMQDAKDTAYDMLHLERWTYSYLHGSLMDENDYDGMLCNTKVFRIAIRADIFETKAIICRDTPNVKCVDAIAFKFKDMDDDLALWVVDKNDHESIKWILKNNYKGKNPVVKGKSSMRSLAPENVNFSKLMKLFN